MQVERLEWIVDEIKNSNKNNKNKIRKGFGLT